MDRRHFLVGASALALSGAAHAQTKAHEPILTDDGLYKEPWFLESFLDLAEDLEGARKQNKRLSSCGSSRAAPTARKRIS